jgi:hypothetical protein
VTPPHLARQPRPNARVSRPVVTFHATLRLSDGTVAWMGSGSNMMDKRLTTESGFLEAARIAIEKLVKTMVAEEVTP